MASRAAVIISKPRTATIPVRLDDGKTYVLTLREQTYRDSRYIMEETERLGLADASKRRQSMVLLMPAFVSRLADDREKRALMEALEVHDDAGLAAILDDIPEAAAMNIIRAMESLAPPEDKGASRSGKKTMRSRLLTLIIWSSSCYGLYEFLLHVADWTRSAIYLYGSSSLL